MNYRQHKILLDESTPIPALYELDGHCRPTEVLLLYDRLYTYEGEELHHTHDTSIAGRFGHERPTPARVYNNHYIVADVDISNAKAED